MKFGMFTCGYQRSSLERAFSDAKAFGYDYIELWGGRPHGYAPDLLKGDALFLTDLIERYEIPVKVYTPEHNAYPYNYMLGSRAQWQESVDYLKKGIQAAALIGAEAMLVSMGHSGGLWNTLSAYNGDPFDSAQARLKETLDVLADEANRWGRKIYLENLTPMESDVCTTLDEYCELLDEVKTLVGDGQGPLLGMCDVVVPYVQGEDPCDYARRLGARMDHLHLTDSNGMDDSHVMPGDGVMDLASVLTGFREAGYDGSCTIELVTNYIDDPSGAAELALRRIKEIM